MKPNGIDEKDFNYNLLPPAQFLKFYDEFMAFLDQFALTIKQHGDLVVNVPIIGRICVRVDQRKDYYLYYHSTENNIMHMSQEKELALWAYWVSKYKPVRFENVSDEEVFFAENGCTVSDAFSSYIIISAVCSNNEAKVAYFTDKVVADLNYDLTNRDFSKEAIISKINDLIA